MLIPTYVELGVQHIRRAMHSIGLSAEPHHSHSLLLESLFRRSPHSTMASLPPPISVLSLSTVALIVVGLAILGFAIAQAAYGPDVLRSEEDWLERVHTFYLPRLCQLEEDIYTAQLQDWEATGQQLLSTRGKAEEIREHEDRRPTRQCMLTKVPSLINR